MAPPERPEKKYWDGGYKLTLYLSPLALSKIYQPISKLVYQKNHAHITYQYYKT